MGKIRVREFPEVFGNAPDYGEVSELQEMLFRTERCWEVFHITTGISQSNIVEEKEALRIATEHAARGNKILLVRYSRYLAEGKLVVVEKKEM